MAVSWLHRCELVASHAVAFAGSSLLTFVHHLEVVHPERPGHIFTARRELCSRPGHVLVYVMKALLNKIR